MKALVVGGGIIGTSIALELATNGIEVVVLDKATPGSEASQAAAGMLAPQAEAIRAGPMFELMLRSRTLYPKWVKGLEALSGLEVGYLPSGLLHVAFDDAEAHALDARVSWQQAHGLRAKWLTGAETRQREPALAEAVLAAAHFADDHQVDPRKLMPALLMAAARSSVTFRAGTVRSVTHANGKVTGVDFEGELLYADVVILAAGAWSALITGTPLTPRDVRPARGQLAELHSPLPLITHVLKSGPGYLVPRADGRLIIGSTMELVGYDKQVTTEGLAKILVLALRLVPALANVPVRATWAGLRPWTEDALPILGEGEGVSGLVFATGHFRNGILLAPLTARLVGQIVRGEKPGLDVMPFHPARFSR